MSDSLTSSIEPESKQPALSERELLDLYENPDLFKSIVGGDAFNAIEEIDPDFVNKFIVSNYLSESHNIDNTQILENYESYAKSIGYSGIPANDANDIASDIRKTQRLSLQEVEPVTFKEGVSGAAQRGIQNLSQAYSLMGISDPIYQSFIDGKISEINQLDKVLESGLEAKVKERARRQQESAKQFIARTLLFRSNEIKNFIDAQSKIESAKLSEGYKSFVDSGNIPTSPKAFGEFLVGFMTEQTVQQAPTALKTIMSGPAGSPAVLATVFSESFHQERAFEMMQHLRENGVDFNDQESLNAALSNDELMSDAMLRGMGKSLPIAITSALSAYLPIKGKTALGKLGKEVVTQAGLDSVGEVLGQSFATGEVDIQEVMLEVLGGTTQSVAEFSAKVAANVAKSPINSILKNEDGSIKSRKEVVALSEYLPDDFAEEISEVDPVTGNLVVEAIRGNSEAYDILVPIIRSFEKAEVEVSPELKKLSDAINELESITIEIETNLDVVDETVGVELEGASIDLDERISVLKSEIKRLREAANSDKDNSKTYYDEYEKLREQLRLLEFEKRNPGAKSLNREEADKYISNLIKLNDNVKKNENDRFWKKGEKISKSPDLGGKFKAILQKGTKVFRSVTLKDWERIQSNGKIDSDLRDTISNEEGINLAFHPESSRWYIPDGETSVILAIDTDGLDGLFMIGADDYLRSNQPIPIENIVAVSNPIGKDLETSQFFIPAKQQEAGPREMPIRGPNERDKAKAAAAEEAKAKKIEKDIQAELSEINEAIEVQLERAQPEEGKAKPPKELTKREEASVSKLLNHISGQGKKLSPKELAVTREKIRGDVRLAKRVQKELIRRQDAIKAERTKADARVFAEQEKFANLKERQEQSRRKAKDAAKERFSKMESRYKEKVAKLKQEAKDSKVKNEQAWVDERADVKELSKQIQEFLNVLPPVSRGKVTFLRKMSKATTVDSRLKVLQEVVDRVNSLIDEDFIKGRKAFLRAIVKKATKGDAKAVSKKLGPNAEIVQKIDRIMKSSAEENQAAMLEELSQLPEDSEEARVVSTLYDAFSNIDTKEPKQLNASIALVEEIIKHGKEWRKQFKEKKLAETRKLRGDFFEEINVVDPTEKGKALLEDDIKLSFFKQKKKRKPNVLLSKQDLETKRNLAGVFSEWLEGADWYISTLDGIEQLIENLIRVPGTQYAGKLHDQITKPAFKAAEDFLTKQRITREAAFDSFNKVLKDQGLTPSMIKNLFMNLRKPPNFGKGDSTGVYFESQPGYGVKEQPITKDQGIQLWMWRQDKTLQGSFDTMQWTDDVDAQLNYYIGKEGIALGKYMMSVYKKLGVEMNDVLFEVEGWKLPIIENYSPVSKHAKNAVLDIEETMKDGIVKSTAKNNSMKLRVDEKAALDATRGALEVFDKHISEMNHYITHGEVAARMKNLFNDDRVKRAIIQIYGPQRVKLIKHMIDNFTRGGIDYGRIDPFVSKLIRNVAVGKLALNFPSAVKQLGSIPAYANAMPAAEWGAGFISFLKNPSSSIKILLETNYIKNRITTTGDRDLRAIAESKSFQQAAMGAKSWRDRLMILTRLGDVGAIMAGGWPIYKKTYDDAIAAGKSMSEAKKMAEFEFGFVSDRSQQSSKTQNLSYFQSTGSFSKLFTMFMTSPIQYMRITTSAIRAAYKGRIKKRTAIKTFAIYHIILPQIFTAMGSMGIGIFSDDEEKQEAWWRRQRYAAALGNLNAFFLAGDALDALLGSIIKDEQFFDLSNPVVSELSSIVKSAANIGEEGNLSDLVGSMMLLLGGIPYDTISREFEAKYELLQRDDVYQNIWGISDYAAFENQKRKKKKKSTSDYYFN